jgi:hypothetical protein
LRGLNRPIQSPEYEKRGLNDGIAGSIQVSESSLDLREGWKIRLQKASRDVELSRQAHEDALERRGEVIVAAMDAGLSYEQVARAANLSTTRVVQIVAKHG